MKPEQFPGPVRVVVCEELTKVRWDQLAYFFDIPNGDFRAATDAKQVDLIWEHLKAHQRLSELRNALIRLGWSHIVTIMDKALKEYDQASRAFAVPTGHNSFNSAHFDLKPLRRPLLAARYDPGPLLCFGLPHHDVSVGDKLLDWLEDCYHPISRKPRLSLGPIISTARSVVDAVLRHQGQLATTDIVRHIDATRAPAQTLTSFVEQLAERLGQARHRLVLLVTVAPDADPPPLVRRLPLPQVVRTDVEDWAMEALAFASRDVGLPDAWMAWTALICAHAAEEDDSLDPRRIFESMDQSIQDLLTDFDVFVTALREATGYA